LKLSSLLQRGQIRSSQLGFKRGNRENQGRRFIISKMVPSNGPRGNSGATPKLWKDSTTDHTNGISEEWLDWTRSFRRWSRHTEERDNGFLSSFFIFFFFCPLKVLMCSHGYPQFHFVCLTHLLEYFAFSMLQMMLDSMCRFATSLSLRLKPTEDPHNNCALSPERQEEPCRIELDGVANVTSAGLCRRNAI